MVSNDKVALSTLEDIFSLLVGWQRATEEGLSAQAPRGLRPASALPQSAHRRRFGALHEDTRPGLTPASAYNYILDLESSETTRVQDYRERVRTCASTMTDSVGILRAIDKAKKYSRHPTAAGGGVGRRSPPRVTQTRAPSSLSIGTYDHGANFDFMTLEGPAPPRQEVIRVNMRPLSAREPREAATKRLQRPASARVYSTRDAGYMPASGGSPVMSKPRGRGFDITGSALAESEALSIRQLTGTDSTFSPLRIQMPRNTMHHASSDDHLRWLNAATCEELVSYLCL
jgi:hypothetical protein